MENFFLCRAQLSILTDLNLTEVINLCSDNLVVFGYARSRTVGTSLPFLATEFRSFIIECNSII